MPDIFQYTDYRKFLRDFYEAKKAAQKGYTHRYISKALGFKSTGSFAQILQGKTNISTQMITNFVGFLKLKKEEGDYFELMVLFNQSKSHAEKKRYFEKVIAFPKSNFKVVDSAQYAYYEKWYYSVIREILAFYPFKDDYKELAKMLEPQISQAEAQKAVKLLEDLNFVKQDENGYYKKVDAIITTGYEAKSLAINQFTLETMELAKASMDSLPREERSLSTLTLSMPEDGYQMLEEKIKGFRRELLELAKNSEAPKRVLVVNFQIFPVTKTYHDGKEGGKP